MKCIKSSLITLLLILTSCASTPARKPPSIYPDINKHIETFEKHYGKHVTGIDIRIARILDMDGTVMLHVTGVCNRITKEIVFNKYRWFRLEDWKREHVVFHELGHCVLGKGHPDHQAEHTPYDFMVKQNCPSSLMYSGTQEPHMTEKCYKENRDFYIMELFL